MRSFPVPFNIQSEDKIIGGYLSLRQFFWCAFPGLVFVLLFFINRSYAQKTETGSLKIYFFSILIRAVISIAFAVFGGFMAFKQFNEITADKYLLKSIKYKLRNHTVKYGR